jgi:ABC-2 type transport system ATP-binding protein
MSEAVVVNQAYKKFGKPTFLLKKKFPRTSSLSGDEGLFGTSDNLQLNYVVAVDHISFTVQRGEIFGILGPHHSGKSTLVKMLATQLLPDEGEIHIFGHDVVSQSEQIRRMVNRVSVDASFFMQLSPVENLLYRARQYGLVGREARQRVEELLIKIGIYSGSWHQPMETLTRIDQQKMTVASALISSPQLLLLDEPTTGLDTEGRDNVEEVLKEYRLEHGATLLITGQATQVNEEFYDRVAVIDCGKVITTGAPASLNNPFSINQHSINLEGLNLDKKEALI